MLRENRARGDMEWKDVSGSPYLLPGESARTPYPFPDKGDGCPHCGERTNLVWRPNFFRCYKCSQVIEKPLDPIQPVTPDLINNFLDGLPYEEIVCERCGKAFVKKLKAGYTKCHSCRAIEYNAEYRSRERKERRVINNSTPGGRIVPGAAPTLTRGGDL